MKHITWTKGCCLIVFFMLWLFMKQSLANSTDSNSTLDVSPITMSPRLGDILKKNIYKYYRNIEEFHQKLTGKWKDPVELKIPENPFEYLIPLRSCKQTIDIGMYFRGETKEDIFVSEGNAEKKAALNESCLYDGGIPVLSCKELDIIEGKLINFCFCSNDISNPSPFVYSYNGSHCVGDIGSVCDERRLGCLNGLSCQDGICGGKDGWIERVFAGQQVLFTDTTFEDILIERNDSFQIKSDLYLSTNIPRIGFTCNPKLYHQVIGHFIDLLKKLNTSEFDEEVSDEKFVNSLSIKLFMLDLFMKESDSLKINIGGSQIGLEYNQNERCFDQFPRMSCVAEELNLNLDRGQCVCSNFSKYFNYTEENGRCVGRIGSVCTIVRGSSDLFCQYGLKCETIVWSRTPRKSIPTPLTHLEIKVCGGWKGLVTQNELDLRLASDQTSSGFKTNVSDSDHKRSSHWLIICETILLNYYGMKMLK